MGRFKVSAIGRSLLWRSDKTRPLSAFGASRVPSTSDSSAEAAACANSPLQTDGGHQPGIEVTTRQAGHLSDRLGGRRTGTGPEMLDPPTPLG